MPTEEPRAGTPKPIRPHRLLALTVGWKTVTPISDCALDASGTLGAWQKVAGNCRDSWPVTIAGSQGIGTQKGLTLLATGNSKPRWHGRVTMRLWDLTRPA